MKVAIVHDFLNQMGGAEHVVKILREIFPEAPIYTSVYDPSAVCPSFQTADVRTSFMQRLPMIKRHARRYLALYPYAFELFDLSEFDVVLSSSSSFAKGVVTKPHTCHVCYCYTPMRFVWNYHTYIQQEPLSRLAKNFLPYVIHRLRRWDEITADRVDYYIAISDEIRRRIAKYYRRDATIIHPPVDTSRFKVSTQDDGHFLVLSRLLPYKRIDIVIEAFNRMKLPLTVVGAGRDFERLTNMAGPTVRMLGRLPESEMMACLESCRALIFPGLEDFGLAPLEAMACGKPVIAYAAGGARETVREGVTGAFFREQTPDAIERAVTDFDPNSFDAWETRGHAELFDVPVFKEQIRKFVTRAYQEYSSSSALSGLTTDQRFGILAKVDERIFGPERETAAKTADE